MPFVERIRGAFPDINIVVEDVFGAEDKVVLRWSATMTHRGDHLGMPATGERVRISGMTIARIGDKQIIEGWDNWDHSAPSRATTVRYRSPGGCYGWRATNVLTLCGSRHRGLKVFVEVEDGAAASRTA